MRTVYAELRSLDHAPRRNALAEEDRYRDYEIRRPIIGHYLALYTVDDAASVVHIIGFRHGSRLPRLGDLPDKF